MVFFSKVNIFLEQQITNTSFLIHIQFYSKQSRITFIVYNFYNKSTINCHYWLLLTRSCLCHRIAYLFCHLSSFVCHRLVRPIRPFPERFYSISRWNRLIHCFLYFSLLLFCLLNSPDICCAIIFRATHSKQQLTSQIFQQMVFNHLPKSQISNHR